MANRSCVPDAQIQYTATYALQGLYGFTSIVVYVLNVIALYRLKNTVHRTFTRLYFASALWSSIYFLCHFGIRRFLRLGYFCNFFMAVLGPKTFILHPYRIVSTYAPIMILFLHFMISVHRLSLVISFKAKMFWERNARIIMLFGLLVPLPFMWFVLPYKGYAIISPSGGLGLDYDRMQIPFLGELSATFFSAVAAFFFGILTVVNTFVTIGYIKIKKTKKVENGILLFELCLALFTLVYAGCQVLLYITMHTIFKDPRMQETIESIRYFIIDIFILPHAWTLFFFNDGVRREIRKLFKRHQVVLPVSASSDKH